MIAIDLRLLLSMGVCISVGLMLVRFLKEKYIVINWLRHTKFLQRCSFCTHLFFVYRHDVVGACPRCEHLVSLDHILETENEK